MKNIFILAVLLSGLCACQSVKPTQATPNSSTVTSNSPQTLVGKWKGVIETYQGNIPAVLVFSETASVVQGHIEIMGSNYPFRNIKTANLPQLSFDSAGMDFSGNGTTYHFEGAIEGNTLSGKLTEASMGEMKLVARR